MLERTQMRVDGRLTERARLEELRMEILADLEDMAEFAAKGGVVLEEWKANLAKQGQRANAAYAEIMALGGGDVA